MHHSTWLFMSLLGIKLRSSCKARTLPTELRQLKASFDRDVRMDVAILIAFWSAVCMAVSHSTAGEIRMSWERPVAEASSAAHIATGIRGARTWFAVVTSPSKRRASHPASVRRTFFRFCFRKAVCKTTQRLS